MRSFLAACLVAAASGRAVPALDRHPRVLALRGGAAPRWPVSSVYTPKEAYLGMADKGAANAKLSLYKTLHQSVMGGMYVGFGALLSLTVAGNMAKITDGNPGLQKFIFAALFPVNLFLILTTGGQLFTGNTAAVAAAIFEGKATLEDLYRSWGVSYAGNILGCVGFALLTAYTGLLTGGTAELAAYTATKKCASAFGPTLVKAILCNWLVCMAVFLSGAAHDIAGKMVAIWFPISTFVAIGFEHSVANLYLLPLGMLAKAKISFFDVVFKNLIPATIGNAIAGALIVAAGYSYQFGKLGEEKPSSATTGSA